MLSDHHEWLTAHTLLTLQIWDSKSLNYFNAQPVINFQNYGDKGITQLGSLKGVCDANGNGYYVSYPQFAFQMPYLILRLVNAKINVTNLQILNLILHFVSALFLFLLMLNMVEGIFLIRFLAATATYIVYVFSAGNLWFLQNVWFADTLVQFFLISSLLFYFLFEKTKKIKFQYLFFLSQFFMCITEWIGVLFVSVFLCFQLYEILFHKKSARMFLVSLSIVSISIIIIVAEYLSITTLNNLISFWKFRFMSRT
ncbi:MAG: hypothetical protein RIQ33_1185, partial [Bacteroidota bacterium]